VRSYNYRSRPEGFQMLAGSIAPSHAYVHVVEFDISVTIHSMEVQSGDLIHAAPSERDGREHYAAMKANDTVAHGEWNELMC
jgi:hypothetical protein